LAPPVAAETLSALLLRLQTDYDEELTKTINELLGSTFIEHLRDRLAEAERLRSDINAKLAQNPTSVSGLTLRLIRVPVSEERSTVPLASVYEVRRAPQPLPGVSLELAVWTGNELTYIPTPDPADLPDLAAVPSGSSESDDLFSAL
jgi:hypothetical protein